MIDNNKYEKISVVVCTYNRFKSLKRTLSALCSLDYEDYEIVVIDDGSTDDTSKLKQEFKRINFIRQKHQGIGAARNRGALESRADLIAYIDDDCIPDKDWLKKLVEAMHFTGSDIIGGDSYSKDNKLQYSQHLVDKFGTVYFSRYIADNRNTFLSLNTLNVLVKKKVFKKVKFDPYYVSYFEDVDFCIRAQSAGFKIAHTEQAKIIHFNEPGWQRESFSIVIKHPIYFSVKNFGLNYSFIIHTVVSLIKTTAWFFISKKVNKIIPIWWFTLIGIMDGLAARRGKEYGC